MRSLNHCCSGKATMSSVCVELHVTFQMYKNIDCCTKMFLCQICFSGNNKPYVSLQVNTRSCTKTKEGLFADGLL
jgi:hypothetical protein